MAQAAAAAKPRTLAERNRDTTRKAAEEFFAQRATIEAKIRNAVSSTEWRRWKWEPSTWAVQEFLKSLDRWPKLWRSPAIKLVGDLLGFLDLDQGRSGYVGTIKDWGARHGRSASTVASWVRYLVSSGVMVQHRCFATVPRVRRDGTYSEHPEAPAFYELHPLFLAACVAKCDVAPDNLPGLTALRRMAARRHRAPAQPPLPLPVPTPRSYVAAPEKLRAKKVAALAGVVSFPTRIGETDPQGIERPPEATPEEAQTLTARARGAAPVPDPASFAAAERARQRLAGKRARADAVIRAVKDRWTFQPPHENGCTCQTCVAYAKKQLLAWAGTGAGPPPPRRESPGFRPRGGPAP